jgi:hypothetical protein
MGGDRLALLCVAIIVGLGLLSVAQSVLLALTGH